MRGLELHIHTVDPEEHARLAFRRDCPHCRMRLAGPPPSRDVVSPRAKGALATAAVFASGALPVTDAAAQGEEAVEVEPPPGAGTSGASGPPISPPGDHSSSGGGEAPSTENAGSSDGEGDDLAPSDESSAGPDSGGDRARSGGADGGGSGGSSAKDDPAMPPPVTAGPVSSSASPGPPHLVKPLALLAESGERERLGQGDDGGSDRHQLVSSQEVRAIGERYTVERGDCLWSIARDLLGQGASDARIAAKVSELWDLNDTDVIRTGDPNLIHPGQKLRLA